MIRSTIMNESLTREPEIDLSLVKEWARQAGEIALRYFNRVEGTRKEDRTLVSAADLEIEDLLVSLLKKTYPGHGIVGEEGTNEIRGEYVWAIDPLDGTRSFLSGLPVWGVSIGLLWRGQPWLGVFHLPLLDDWYYSAHPTAGAFWNDHPIHCPVPDGWDEDSLLCIPADVHLRYSIRFPGIVRALGSAAAHLCYVARGNAMAVFLDRPGIWDIAAGAAIVRAAGGTLRYLEGTEVFGGDLLDEGTTLKPLVGAHPSIVDRLRAHIEPNRSS
jgi:myo-inositol-1(or 4)-monophosphatase